MIKLDNRVGANLVVLLAWLQNHREGIENAYHDNLDALNTRMEEGADLTAVENVLQHQANEYGYLDPYYLITEPLEQIVPQVLTGQPAGETTLVEKVIEILQQPYSSSRLTVPVISALKKALLTTEETIGLEARLAKTDLACCRCGGGFEPNEMATYRQGGFLCAACLLPEVQACQQANCGTKHTIQLKPRVCPDHGTAEDISFSLNWARGITTVGITPATTTPAPRRRPR